MLKVFAGLVLGLLLAELAFNLRDGGAFAHLNIYEADAELGARLERNAHTTIAFGGNPATAIRTNAHGLRGDALPKQAAAIVVGDSQVFGLGVQEQDTFSAKLASLTGKAVINAGVPTYGPQEYTAMIERLAPALKPSTVIYVVNLANDLFELDRPNADRHSVWDGWAVRKETAPSAVTEFAGRRWLMSRSHLVYALRGLLQRASDDAAFSSEGSWKDIANTKAPASLPSLDDDARQTLQERSSVARQLAEVNGKMAFSFTTHVFSEPQYAATAKELAHYAGDVRDIVGNPYAEAARPVDTTAAQLLRAAIAMDKNAPVLRKLAEEKKDKELLALLDRRQVLRGKLATLNAQSGAPIVDSALAAALQRAKQAAADAGAQLLVVALPLDVQVSSDEWKKYERPALDMRPSEALATWVVQTAERLGARGLDATVALRAAEPGAFLNADLHLSPKGHAALAQAIADKLAEPDKPNALSLPAGRSWLPTQDEWAAEAEVTVKGSTAAHCETKIVREWFRVRCSSDVATDPLEDPKTPRLGAAPSLQLIQGGQGDAYVSATGNDTTLVTPLGEDVVARFTWDDHARTLSLTRTSLSFGDREPAKRPALNVQPKRLRALSMLDQACLDANKPRSACAIDQPTRDPTCADGETPFGATRRCVPDCSKSNLCAGGARCLAWQGSSGCVQP